MGEDRTPYRRRLTVAQAAGELGISAEAVRGRIRRGTLAVEREGGTGQGRVYVLLDLAEHGRTTADQSRTTGGQPSDRPGESGALTSELRDRLRYVEGQLEAERQAHAEARRIIAGLVERIPPAIEAPRDERESPESPGPSDPGETSTEERGGPQRSSERPQERRSLWQRLFGG